MGRHVTYDLSEYREFFQQIRKAAKGDFKKELGLFLEGLGNEFLRIIVDEIIRRKVMSPNRQLLHSFSRGDDYNVWEIKEGGLTLEIGSDVEYAKFVNDGHWTIDPSNDGSYFYLKNGEMARFVPGHWAGDQFIHEKGAKAGMVLKQKWVPPQPYFDDALRILDRLYPKLLEEKLQQWIDSYFGG